MRRTIAATGLALWTACAARPAPEASAPEPTVEAPPVLAQSAAPPKAELSPPPKAVAPPPQSQPPDPNDCNPFLAPVERRAGSLVVHAPPREPSAQFLGRLRSHLEGSLSKASERVWVGPQVPGFVPLALDSAELWLLDHQSDGTFLAFYRDPYGAGSCGLGDAKNCHTVAQLFAHCGEVLWSVSLDPHLSKPERLEVQDVRLDDGTLYFNEACQSYASESGGRCSSLVALDPAANAVLWRTKSLVSNNRFFIADDYVVAGYGFTAEPDNLFVVRRSDGKVMQKIRLPKAHENIELLEPGVLRVTVYPGDRFLDFRMTRWDGPKPKLVRLKP
ncbi:MAG: hypothetical protein AAGA54_10870 [Myxococcota bacterium]